MNANDPAPKLTRRVVLGRGVAGAALLALPPSARAGLAALIGGDAASGAPGDQVPDQRREYLSHALAAARWLKGHEVRRAGGLAWPIAPDRSPEITEHLYRGMSGVVLFLLELHHATGDEALLIDASAGADYLAARIESGGDALGPGLYTGIAGIGFTLEAAHRSTRSKKHLEGARRCVAILRERAKPAGKGVEWGEVTDIIAGSSGIGLYLLDAGRRLGDESCLELATRAGRRLVELGDRKPTGLDWGMTPTYARRMPNFSHGTAGVAYFLATLYRITKDTAFLEAAVAGAKHVLSLSAAKPGTCLIRHHEPGGEDLFYLGWCHGPAGTGRLFQRLHQVTGDDAWMTWVHDSAREVMASGIPEKATPGFWNNAGVCCGTAGLAGYFLDLHQATGRRAYLDFAHRMMADLVARGKSGTDGIKWIHAEHRVRPEDVAAQTGLMQGSGGIGLLLLRFHLHGVEKSARIVLPDTPFS